MYTALFWKDVFERLVSTLAQVLIALLTADGFDLLNADWKAILVTLAVSGALVVLKALVAAKATDASISPASLVEADRGV